MDKKNKAERNRTIDLSVEEGKQYLDRCICITEKAEIKDVLNKTILGDTFEALKLLPEKSIDLLIADPPYNLDKDFNGNVFKKTSYEMYEQYTEEWLLAILPLLKDNAVKYIKDLLDR